MDGTVSLHLLLSSLLLPPVSLLLLALGGAWRWRRGGRGGLTVLLAALAGLYLSSTPQLAIWLAGPLERYPVLTRPQLQQAQAIVVLGGGVLPAPELGAQTVSAPTLQRLRYGAHLARASGLPLLVTGGAPTGGEPEALAMARTLNDDFGIAPRWVEVASNTTLDNARYSARLLKHSGIHRIVLVSHGWHLRRALPFFAAQGFTVYPAPTALVRYQGPGWTRWLPSGRASMENAALLREYLGLLYYTIRS